jgi:hypothetical protein
LTVSAALKCSTLPSSRRTSPVVAIRVTRENGGQLAFDAFRGQSGESGTFAPALMEGTVETDPPAEGEVMSEAGSTPIFAGPSRVRLVKAPASEGRARPVVCASA